MMAPEDILIGVTVFIFAVVYFIHDLRWVNSQLRGRPWENDETEEDK